MALTGVNIDARMYGFLANGGFTGTSLPFFTIHYGIGNLRDEKRDGAHVFANHPAVTG
jgi:CobQ-like glutamine amidotransferase family enzyme